MYIYIYVYTWIQACKIGVIWVSGIDSEGKFAWMSCDELHILVWFRMSCPSDAGSLTLKHQVMGQRLETAATVPLLQDRGFQKLCPQTKEAGFGAFVVVGAFCSWLLLVLWCWLMLVVVVDKPALIVNLVVCYSTGLYLFCDFFSFPLSMWGWVMPYLWFSMCKSSRTSYFNFSGKGTDRVLIHTWVGRGFP